MRISILDPIEGMLTASANSVDEGASIDVSLADGMPNTDYSYTITGVDAADISLPLTGTFTTDANGAFTGSIAAIADRLTEGAETMTVSIDGTNLSTAIAINDTSLNNVAPVASPVLNISGDEDTTISASVGATDGNGDTLTYSVSSAAANGTASVDAAGNISYVPNANFNGLDTFVVTIDDGFGGVTTQTVIANVAAVNDAPTAAPTLAISGDEDTTLSGSVGATDVEGDALTYSISSAASNGTASVDAAGNISYAPNANFNGSDSFVVTIDDGKGGVSTQTVNATVAPVNDAPTAAPTLSISGDEDTTLSGTVGAADIDGDTLTYTISTAASNGTATVDASGNISYAPNANFNGSDSFVVTIDDGNGGVITQTVNATVAPVNDAPTAAPTLAISGDEDTTISGSVGATDVDGDTLTYSISSAASNGTATVDASGNISYAPNANFNGSDSFVVTIDDGNGGVITQTVNATVAPVADLTLAPASATVNEGQVNTFTASISSAQATDTVVTFQLAAGDNAAANQGTNTTNLNDFGAGSFNPVTATIVAGQTSVTFDVTGLSDNITETGENYSVTASTTAFGGESATSTVTLLDPSAVGGLGQTFTLTTGVDTIPGLVGSAGSTGTDGNDTIVGLVDAVTPANDTLNALDQINGGLGTDTLTLNSVGNLAGIPGGVTIQNVETIGVRSSGTTTLDTTAVNGLTTLNSTLTTGAASLTAATTTNVNVSGVTGTIATNGGQNITVTDTTAGNNITIGDTTVNNGTVTVTDNIAGATIAVDGGTDVSVTATGATANGGNAITIGAGGAATDLPTGAVTVSNTAAPITADAAATTVGMGDIAVSGGTTVNVTQSANAANGVADNGGDLITQGDVTVTGGNTTTSVNVKQDDQATGVAAIAAVTGVQQTQTVTFSALTTGQTAVVNGLTFTAAKNLTAAEVAQAFAGLTSGDRQDEGGPISNGTYSGQNNTLAYTSGPASGATVTYTAVAADSAQTAALTVGGTGTNPTVAAGAAGVTAVAAVAGVVGVASGGVNVNDGGTASITDVVVDSYNGAILGGGGSLNALQNLTLKNSGTSTATLTSASTTLNVTLDDVDGTVNLGGNVTNLTLNTSGTASTGAVNAAAATSVVINAGAALTSAGTFAAATALDINGSAAVNLTGATLTAMTALNAADNSGGVTATANANTVVTGSTGADAITFGAATVASDLGMGNDTAIINQNVLGAGGSVEGGMGIDTLSMGYANAVAASLTPAFDSSVTGFERLLINNAASNGDGVGDIFTVNLANLTYDYVTVNGTTAGGAADTLALTGMAANGTVAFGAGSASDLYTVALADATGPADVINYVMNTADDGAGTSPTLNGGTVTANGVETFNIASTTGDANGATNTLNTVGDAVTAINVTGNANLALTAANATLTTVDASAMTAGGLQFTASNANMTVTGGAGADVLTAGANGVTLNGGGGNDRLSVGSFDQVKLDGGAGIDTFDFNGVASTDSVFSTINNIGSGDVIDLAGLLNDAGGTNAVGATFNATAVTLAGGATPSTQAFQDAAMGLLDASGDDIGFFQFDAGSGTNTFIVVDRDGNGTYNDGVDFTVLLTGAVDLSTASFNATSGTIEIA